MWCLFLPLLSDVVLAAVLVPVLVMVPTALILVVVCTLHWRNRCTFFSSPSVTNCAVDLLLNAPVPSSPRRKKSSEGMYDLPHWDRTGMALPCVTGRYVLAFWDRAGAPCVFWFCSRLVEKHEAAAAIQNGGK